MTTSIRVRELSRPTLTMVMTDFRNEQNSSAVVNISGYTIELVVKRDLDDDDSEALFTVAASIVVAGNGTYKFELDEEHTGLAPGTYPGEIHWWKSGASTSGSPTDALSVSYVVETAVSPRRDRP